MQEQSGKQEELEMQGLLKMKEIQGRGMLGLGW